MRQLVLISALWTFAVSGIATADEPPLTQPRPELVARPPVESEAPLRTPLHHRWWFWTGLLALGTAAATVTVVATLPQNAPIPVTGYGDYPFK